MTPAPAVGPARPPGDVARDLLAEIWGGQPGLYGFLTAVNHRAIGLRFVVTAFVFLLLGGLLALVMRLQLARPGLDILAPGTFNQFFTMHGSTMMFLFAVPMMEGIGIYLTPLMIGTRDMAFPRLNAFGYWVYAISGLTLYISLVFGVAPDGGWFNYPPLTGPGFSPGANIDFWVTLITFIEVSALVAAVELIVTVFKQRAPGMALHRLPLFVWSQLVMSFMVVFAMPPLMVVSVQLMLDRVIGTHFFNPAAGGDPLLWQHLFWIFGHPDVYIILVPALGIVSAIVPVAARRPLAGYTLVAASVVAVGFLSFGLWVHHMYATGLPLLGLNFFAMVGMMITIPNAVQIFAWIVTIWRGRLVITTAALYVIGFIVLLIAGGITGIMVASPPFDWQVHDTYFVVAHFHYVLIGGTVFPVFAALHFWFPKVTGRLLGERLGRWNFWVTFVGFNLTFLPMHLTGLRGMPRRVYTFVPGLGLDWLNLVATVGAWVMGLGVLLFVLNVYLSLILGRRAGDDPWGGGTLEWATASPPPPYNFAAIPIVRSRDPLWEQTHLGLADDAPGTSYLTVDPARPRREILVTTVLDAAPDHVALLPGPSLWPFWAAFGTGLAFIGSMVHLLLVPLGAAIAFLAFVVWLWPPREAMPA
jgi:cytochrome c oxidase subunit I+III